jgi:hypothetical protein
MTATIAGTAQVLALTDWITPEAARRLNPKVSPAAVAVVVTTYGSADYFEVHAVCQNAAQVLDGPSGTDRSGRDLPQHLFAAIARVLGSQPGWRAKAPSGSTYGDALKANGRADKLL